MADHLDEQILDSVKTTVTGLTTTSTNVQRDRAHSIPESQTRALSVEMGASTPLDEEDYNDIIHVSLELQIIINVVDATGTPLTQTLNLIRKELTAALLADYTQGLSFVYRTLEGSAEKPDIEAGSKPEARQITNWEFHYERSRIDASAAP